MTRIRRTLALGTAAALVVGACASGGSEVIATFGEVTVTQSDLAELYETDTLPIDEELRGTIFALIAREVLGHALLEDFGVELEEAEVEAAFEQIESDRAAAGVSPAEFLDIPNASVEMIRFNAHLGAIRRLAIDSVVGSEDFIQTIIDDGGYTTEVCVSHVLVASEDEALTVLGRLSDGEAMAAVAAEVSLDSAPGGDLGCSLAGRFVDAFAQASMAAEIGAFTGPVQTDFGWHVLLVSDRTAATAEEVAADPVAFIPEQEANAAWTRWFNEQLQEATVELDLIYGTWTPVGIRPPEADDSEG